MTLEIDVLTLFPSMVSGPLPRASPAGSWNAASPRSGSTTCASSGLGRHRSVDDTPYGGGAGMVMRVEPVVAAIESVRRPESLVILLDPGGEVFSQARAADLATREHLVFVCPRYEGVDERIRAFVDLELSIGDYVLTGGELPALVVIDAVHAAVARRDRRGVDGRGVVQRGAAGIPAVHASAVVPRDGRPADPHVGRPRCRRGVAPGASDRADAQPAGRTCCPED